MLFYILTFLSDATSEKPGSLSKQPFEIPLSTILLFGLFMFIFFIIMRATAKRSISSRNNPRKTARELVDSQLKENPYHTIERLEELMAALADMSRDINGQIDTRTAKLEILLGKTELKIAEYQKLIEEYKKLTIENNRRNILLADTTDKKAVFSIENKQNSEPDPVDPIAEPISHNVESKIDIQVNDEMENEEEPAEPKIKSEAENANSKILSMANQGMSLSDISRLTGRPSGEVELILNLSGFKSRK